MRRIRLVLTVTATAVTMMVFVGVAGAQEQRPDELFTFGECQSRIATGGSVAGFDKPREFAEEYQPYQSRTPDAFFAGCVQGALPPPPGNG